MFLTGGFLPWTSISYISNRFWILVQLTSISHQRLTLLAGVPGLSWQLCVKVVLLLVFLIPCTLFYLAEMWSWDRLRASLRNTLNPADCQNLQWRNHVSQGQDLGFFFAKMFEKDKRSPCTREKSFRKPQPKNSKNRYEIEFIRFNRNPQFISMPCFCRGIDTFAPTTQPVASWTQSPVRYKTWIFWARPTRSQAWPTLPELRMQNSWMSGTILSSKQKWTCAAGPKCSQSTIPKVAKLTADAHSATNSHYSE